MPILNRSDGNTSKVTAQIITDSLVVLHGEGNIWDSKKKASSQMLFSYQRKPLNPFTKYYWTVQVWDKIGKKSSPAKVASFRTGVTITLIKIYLPG